MTKKCLALMLLVASSVALTYNKAYAVDDVSEIIKSRTEASISPELAERIAACKKLNFQAYQLREAGEYQKASELFWKVLRDYEDPRQSALPLTEIMMEQGNYKEAIDLYRHMIPEQSWNGSGNSKWTAIDTVMRFVFALSVTGNKGEAWDIFQANVKSIPEDLLPLLEPYAEGLRDREHYNNITLRAVAMTVFGYTYSGKVIKPNEDQTILADNSLDVIAAYKLALKYSPRFAPAHYFLAAALKEKGKHAAAKEEWAQAKQYAREPKLKAMIKDKDYLYKTP